MRFESMYNSLLRSYARQSGEKALKKAESIFKKMKKLGLLLRPSPYNSMTSLYSSLGNRDKVNEILREMKENNVELDNVTVNNALRVYAAVSDVATMDKFLADRKEITRLDGLTMLAMAKAYDKYKATRQKDNEEFRTLIGSLLKLGDTKGAEKIYYNECECSGLEFDNRIPDMLVSGYREKGMVMKADKLVNKTLWIRGLATPITLLLEEMDKKGNKVSPSGLRDLIKNLRDSNQLSKALEASTWMCQKKVFNLFSEDYATRLHLTEKVLGLEEAEKFFESSIPENMKDYSVYDTLLSCYARSSNTQSKAEAVFEKMRELGLLSKLSPFNSLISLYSGQGKLSVVNILLCDMKHKNIEPDIVTRNNVLRANEYMLAIDSMEKYKREWDGDDYKETKLEKRTIDDMSKAYEIAGVRLKPELILKAIEITGSEKEVHRLWNEYKEKAKTEISNEGYRIMISSLLKFDDVKGAEEMYGEWQPQGSDFDTRIPCLLISHYSKEGDEMKVRNVVESSRKKQKQMYFETLIVRALDDVSPEVTRWFFILASVWIFFSL
ncbi:putative tetratricopeptide-like helical domain superfamily [Arabidopsis thaliana]